MLQQWQGVDRSAWDASTTLSYAVKSKVPLCRKPRKKRGSAVLQQGLFLLLLLGTSASGFAVLEYLLSSVQRVASEAGRER